MARKLGVAAVVAAVFTIHVVCTAAYLMPQNPMSRYYLPLVERWVDPLFSQRWLLFAPEPATNSLKLWTRYECGGRWTGWRDPAAALMERHQKNRLSSAGKLLYISNNLARELSRETADAVIRYKCLNDPACDARRNAEVRASPTFQRAVQYAVRSQPCVATGAQVMVMQLFPTQYSERHKRKPFSFANVFEYEAVRVGRRAP
jgi:hypothetical protein